MPSLMFLRLVVSEELKCTYVDKHVETESHFIYLICQIVLLMASFQQQQICFSVMFLMRVISKLCMSSGE